MYIRGTDKAWESTTCKALGTRRQKATDSDRQQDVATALRRTSEPDVLPEKTFMLIIKGSPAMKTEGAFGYKDFITL